ncbi:MAG: flagellar basal body rod protein FlgC [Candidatus Marinimicrobia bacterium]|nr:flagellar basal body rod protein FlgC [Candidatus Neomarinimicrobiota bacterium]
MQTTVVGLSSQLKRLETIAENISNAQSGPDANGRVYHKKRVVETEFKQSQPGSFQHEMSLHLKKADPNHFSSPGSTTALSPGGDRSGKVKVLEVGGEVLVNDPTHPQADEKGYVRKPDINVVEEMTGMISASRAYEANISVLQAAKKLAKLTLDI